MNAIRISLEWSRIQPERNQWNQDTIAHYKKMIISMREKHQLVLYRKGFSRVVNIK